MKAASPKVLAAVCGVVLSGAAARAAQELPAIFAEHDRVIAAGVAVAVCGIPQPALATENFRRRAEAVANAVIDQIGRLKPDYSTEKAVSVVVRHQTQVDAYVRAKIAKDGCGSADVRRMIDAYAVEAKAAGGGVDL